MPTVLPRQEIAAGDLAILIAGRPFLVVAEGGLFDVTEAMLIIADLHLEKGSALARRGRLVPPYDSAATLAVLASMIGRLTPKTVVCLGDSFHDGDGAARLGDDEKGQIARLQTGRYWLWVSGNHDPARPAGVGGEFIHGMTLGEIALRHEPMAARGIQEIAGHLHPSARLRTRAGALKRRCLVSDGSRAILPALGAYAGGLDVSHRAFDGLFAQPRLIAYMLDAHSVYPVALSRSRRASGQGIVDAKRSAVNRNKMR